MGPLPSLHPQQHMPTPPPTATVPTEKVALEAGVAPEAHAAAAAGLGHGLARAAERALHLLDLLPVKGVAL
jgi:hypothetical protein